ENLLVGRIFDALPIRKLQQRRWCYGVAADAFSCGRLDAVTNRARHTLIVEGSLNLHVRRESAGEKCNRVMTALAVPRHRDAPISNQMLDVGLVKRLSESIAMR